MSTTKLRALLTFANNKGKLKGKIILTEEELSALLERLEKLEAVALAADRAQDNYQNKCNWFDYNLEAALAELETTGDNK